MTIESDFEPIADNETYKYNFHKGNYIEMRRELASYDWIELFHGKIVEDMYQVLLGILIDLIEKYVPKVKCVPRKR